MTSEFLAKFSIIPTEPDIQTNTLHCGVIASSVCEQQSPAFNPVVWQESSSPKNNLKQQKNRCFKVFDFSHCTYENATNNKLSAVSDLVKIDS